MGLRKLWNIFLCLLTSSIATVTDNTLNDNDTDIVDAVAGGRVIIGTWPLKSSALSVIVKRDNSIRLNAFLDESIDKHTTVQNGHLILKYNHTTKEVSLMLGKVSTEDEGLYQIEESFYRSIESSHEIGTKRYERKYVRWSLELNVFGPHEVKQGYVGEHITMNFGQISEQASVYNYDQAVALLIVSACSILTYSYLYGRLRCTRGDLDKMYTLTIENVTQRDAGLYEVTTGRDKVGRCFLDIKDKPTRAVVGENTRIGWFYNQQGMNRTLLVIHPNQEVMMLMLQTNVPHIKSSFQHRLLYSGDILRSFMLFTLLNVSQSDAGLYTIETVHGSTIPGSKKLIVEAKKTTNVQQNGTSTFATDQYSGCPNLPIPAAIGSVVVIILIICCLIRIRHKHTGGMKTDLRQAHEECDTDLYLTPFGVETPLPLPLMTDGRASIFNTAQSGQFDSSMMLLHRTQNLCVDEYEMVDMSNDDAPQGLFNNEGVICKGNVGESSETVNTPIQDTSGYLTVLGAN